MPFFSVSTVSSLPFEKNLIAKQHEYTTDYQHHCHYRYTFQHLVYLIAKQENPKIAAGIKSKPAVSSKKIEIYAEKHFKSGSACRSRCMVQPEKSVSSKGRQLKELRQTE